MYVIIIFFNILFMYQNYIGKEFFNHLKILFISFVSSIQEAIVSFFFGACVFDWWQ